MVSLAHNTTNDTRFNDFMRDVRELGRDTAQGRDAKPRLAIRIVRAASDGLIDLNDKDTAGRDMAYRIYNEYLEADSKKAVFEHTKGGIKKGSSEVRTLVNFGMMTTVDPVDVLNRAVTIHGNMDDKERQSAFPAMLAVARAQYNDPDSELTDEQISGLVAKQGADPKGQAAHLRQALKNLEKALGAEDADPKLSEKIGLLVEGTTALVGYLAKAEERKQLLAKLAELDPVA